MSQNMGVELHDNTRLVEDIPRIQKNVVRLTGLRLEKLLRHGEPEGVTPKDTGHLASSFRKTESREKIIMSTSAKYAEYLNEGTGVYGPRGQVIKPTNKKALAWGGKNGNFVRKSVKGIKGRHFVEKAIQRLDEKMPSILQQAVSKE